VTFVFRVLYKCCYLLTYILISLHNNNKVQGVARDGVHMLRRACLKAPTVPNCTRYSLFCEIFSESSRDIKFSILLSNRISMASYLFSLLVVTTHALHLTSFITQSLIAPSDMLHLIFGTSLVHYSEFLIQIISSPSQRPLFEHAGLTSYTLLSPCITVSLFHSELKTYFFRKSYPRP